MISEEKMIQGMKKSLKKRKSIIIFVSILVGIVIILQTTLIIWLFHQLNKNINEIITEELQNSIVDQQPTLYMRTFLASFTFTILMFLIFVLVSLISGIITAFFIHWPRTQLIVSMWDRLEKLEQKIQSDHESERCKVGP